MNGMSVKNFCNETLSKTNFPLGRIKVHLILSDSYTISLYLLKADWHAVFPRSCISRVSVSSHMTVYNSFHKPVYDLGIV